MLYRILIIFVFSVTHSMGQLPVKLTRPAQLFIETGTYGSSTGQTPFWQRANQYGIVPNQTTPFFGRAGASLAYRSDRVRRTDWGFGAELAGNAARQPTLLIPELYLKGRWGALEGYAGRRRELVGLADSALSSGSYIWSGNALPIPKVQVALPNFTPLPFTGGLLALRGFFSHGWFPATGFVNHSWLHQSALYGRFGKPSWRIHLYGGFNHQVQWGGQTDKLPTYLVENNRLPSGWRDYLYVISGASLGYRKDWDTTSYSKFDRENRIGNHLGSIDLGMEMQFKRFSLYAYRQNIYETGSLFYLANISDGLNGLRLRRLNLPQRGLTLTELLVEYLDTRSQGGAVFRDVTRGRNNYFNHAQYRDGWAYEGHTIGTPFITPSGTNLFPLTGDRMSNNNRVQVYHIGLAGRFGRACTFQTKLSYSLNYGTYDGPIQPAAQQFSGALWVVAPLSVSRGLTLRASLAVDHGTLYQNTIGASISLRKTWSYGNAQPARSTFISLDDAAPLPADKAESALKLAPPASGSGNSPLRSKDFKVIEPTTVPKSRTAQKPQSVQKLKKQ